MTGQAESPVLERMENRIISLEERLIEAEKTCKKYEDYLTWFNEKLSSSSRYPMDWLPGDPLIKEVTK